MVLEAVSSFMRFTMRRAGRSTILRVRSSWSMRCLLVLLPWLGASGLAQVDLSASEARCLERPDYTCLVGLAQRLTWSGVDGLGRANALVQLVALHGQAGEVSLALEAFGGLSDDEHVYWALPPLVAAMLRAGRDAEAATLGERFPSRSYEGYALIDEERGRLLASVLGVERAVVLTESVTKEVRDAMLSGILAVAYANRDVSGVRAVLEAGHALDWHVHDWLVSGLLSLVDVEGALRAASLAKAEHVVARNVAEVATWLALNGRIPEAFELLGPPLADDDTQRGTEDSIIRGLLAKGDEAGAMRVAERRGLWTVDDMRLELATARLSAGDAHGAMRILEGDFEPQGLSGAAGLADPIRMLAAAGREDLAQSILATIDHGMSRAALMVDLAIGRAQANEDEVAGALGLVQSLQSLEGGQSRHGGFQKAVGELVAAGRYSAASLVADAYGESETYGRLVSGLLEHGEFVRALSIVDRFDASQHHFPVSAQRVAIAMARAGDVAGALELAERDAFADPRDATEAMMDIAELQMEAGHATEARTSLTRSLQLAAALGDDFVLLRRALEGAALLNGFSLVVIMYGM
jgi:hypothetical protein